MDKRLQTIADQAAADFGLDAYVLGRYSTHKHANELGAADYIFTMEWFPRDAELPDEEDLNPDGTAVIDYILGNGRYKSVIFTMDKTLATRRFFKDRTVTEAAAFVERQTGLRYMEHFFAEEGHTGGFRFEARIEGFRLSPGFTVDLEYDEDGRLLTYVTFGELPDLSLFRPEPFNLTLEEIEPAVRAQLKLIHLPDEVNKTILPVYAVDEIYITADGKTFIPYFPEERTDKQIGQLLEWSEPLNGQIERQPVFGHQEVPAEQAAGQPEETPFDWNDIDTGCCIQLVTDALRIEYPESSGIWQLDSLRYEHSMILARCSKAAADSGIISPKIVVFIDPDNMKVINLVNNEMIHQEMFADYAPSPGPVVSHADAFEKMLPSITMEPTYVYDVHSKAYILCGLIDSDQAVDAVTGDVLSLSEL